jgi:DNA-binding response OmpR family regulator
MRVGRLTMDPIAREVRWDGRLVPVTNKEWDLLLTLASEPHRVFSKPKLQRELWGGLVGSSSRTLDSHAHRLRQKLITAGASGLMHSVRGVGFRLGDVR